MPPGEKIWKSKKKADQKKKKDWEFLKKEGGFEGRGKKRGKKERQVGCPTKKGGKKRERERKNKGGVGERGR